MDINEEQPGTSTNSTRTRRKRPILSEESECPHDIIMRNMCGKCGKDLRKGLLSHEASEVSSANVSMVHHIPDLLVSDKLAKELGAADTKSTLKSRKLILLVDLDQTLVHSSNKPPLATETAGEIVKYHLFMHNYYTKLRPNAREFLDRINPFYQMHIFTYGNRDYAEKIASILDPQKIYFGHRVISRDEFLSVYAKTHNLKSLFPDGEELIVMMDDRTDVWLDSDALVHVHPYTYFSNIGDLNSPLQYLAPIVMLPTIKISPPEDREAASTSAIEPEKICVEESLSNQDDTAEKIVEEGSSAIEKPKECLIQVKPSNKKQNLPVFSTNRKEDHDNMLEHVERILIEIHTRFYEHYNATNQLLNVKFIMKEMRLKVFEDERIVFTGIVPMGTSMEFVPLVKTCIRYGAMVQQKIDDLATVLVSGLDGTMKMQKAREKGLPIVTIDWIMQSVYRWRKEDKNDHIFISPHRRNHQQPSDVLKTRKPLNMASEVAFSEMETFNKDTLSSMNDEVDDALTDEEFEPDEEKGSESTCNSNVIENFSIPSMSSSRKSTPESDEDEKMAEAVERLVNE